MNYLVMLKAFYKSIEINPISPKAQCLYNYLLYKNNEYGWIKAFTLSNLIICGQTNLGIKELQRVRNELCQKGYIKYSKGTSNKAGKYEVLDITIGQFVQQDVQQSVQQDVQQSVQRSVHII